MDTPHRMVRSLLGRLDFVRGRIRKSVEDGKPLELNGKIMRECDGIAWALETMHGAGLIPSSISGDVPASVAKWREFHHDIVQKTSKKDGT